MTIKEIIIDLLDCYSDDEIDNLLNHDELTIWKDENGEVHLTY